jgi:hypothetical protein
MVTIRELTMAVSNNRLLPIETTTCVESSFDQFLTAGKYFCSNRTFELVFGL